jgi:hypothetical protein
MPFGFTFAPEIPSVRANIFAAKKLDIRWELRFDARATFVGDRKHHFQWYLPLHFTVLLRFQPSVVS